MAAELAARGVPEALRAGALAESAEGEAERLAAALEKRARALPAELAVEVRTRRLFEHLVRRGFAPADVLEALRKRGAAVEDA